jgi:hypothetical protein
MYTCCLYSIYCVHENVKSSSFEFCRVWRKAESGEAARDSNYPYPVAIRRALVEAGRTF